MPQRLTLVQPELQKLEGPEVQDGKVMFQFTQIEDTSVTVIGGTVGGVKPVTVDHGTIELGQKKLGEMLPAAQKIIAQAAPLAQIRTIGKAQLVAMPTAQ